VCVYYIYSRVKLYDLSDVGTLEKKFIGCHPTHLVVAKGHHKDLTKSWILIYYELFWETILRRFLIVVPR
jgi:hypothetical protein